MAKKNKAAASQGNARHDATGASADRASAEDSQIERAFAAGNYADVQRLGRTNASPRAQALVRLTTIDGGQVLVGLVAIAVVLLVSILTLR